MLALAISKQDIAGLTLPTDHREDLLLKEILQKAFCIKRLIFILKIRIKTFEMFHQTFNIINDIVRETLDQNGRLGYPVGNRGLWDQFHRGQVREKEGNGWTGDTPGGSGELEGNINLSGDTQTS